MSDTVFFCGVDDGNYHCKLALPGGRTLKLGTRVSAKASRRKTTDGREDGVWGYVTQGPRGEEHYSVGDVDNPLPTAFGDFQYSPANRVLVAHALRRAVATYPDLMGKEAAICLGIPVGWYYNPDGSTNKININRKRANVEANNVIAAVEDPDAPIPMIRAALPTAEGLSGYFDYILTEADGRVVADEERKSEGVILVDLGSRTVNIVTVLPGRDGKPLIDFDRTITDESCGMYAVLEEYAKLLRGKYPRIRVEDLLMDEATGGFRLPGNKVECEPALWEEAKASFLSVLQARVGGYVARKNDIGRVIFIGGGALSYGEKELRGWIDLVDAHVPSQPDFANARGNLKFAMRALPGLINNKG